ncbi:PAS domain-containing protein [Sphaerochaeta globosa]|jgi:hypothetical protein|uniref:Hemerythrin-like domain-containing protein n=1 Tax=Sphaerochaeta globosa (strain ATCC BAA-1886 / DSM 22777 / Buddy) TaxID=158189 RepID=F0RZF9_SPHGB|nr:PAS domain-containing protein [Sphaerochaeta globosa]ADY13511.1 hypothetical protein SpiBuddy_1686 [Sphaerochaeta globosa str. Buddy]
MELIHNPDHRIEQLKHYLGLLCSGTTDKETYLRYAGVLESATAFEANSALESILSATRDVTVYTAAVARFIRSVGKGLESQSLPRYPQYSLFASLDEENRRIVRYMEDLQTLAKELQKQKSADLSPLLEKTASFHLIKEHYARLQNELFPLFEKASTEHSCVKLMWAIQDTALGFQKEVLAYGGKDLGALWKVFGQFYVQVGILSYREQYILLPVAYRALSTQQEVGPMQSPFKKFVSRTGALSQEELERIFSILPFDIAFIGSDDRLKFYSDPPHRIFVRTPEVIGRLVQNCHPPKSVHTVQAILDSFKEGREDSAEFYLVMKGKFIHIQYYAVRSTDGEYLGCMEVTQDATHLRSLTGEKRLP